MNSPQPFVRVIDDDGECALWLEPDPNAMRFTGLCLGVGQTIAEAIADARDALKVTAEQLDRLEREG